MGLKKIFENICSAISGIDYEEQTEMEIHPQDEKIFIKENLPKLLEQYYRRYGKVAPVFNYQDYTDANDYIDQMKKALE